MIYILIHRENVLCSQEDERPSPSASDVCLAGLQMLTPIMASPRMMQLPGKLFCCFIDSYPATAVAVAAHYSN